MAVLTTKARKAIHTKSFAGPHRSYPIEDSNAKVLAKGTLTPAEAVKVRHRADAVLGETDSTYHNQPKKTKSVDAFGNYGGGAVRGGGIGPNQSSDTGGP